MDKIKVLTDSASDMPKWIIEEYKDILDVVALDVVSNDEVYSDLEYSQDVLYDNMQKGAVYTTNQVKLSTFLDMFESYAKKETPAIYIGFSSALSGTYSTGRLAMEQTKEKYPQWRCETVDTKSATFAEGLVVYKVLKKIREGLTDINALCLYAKDMSERMYLVAYIQDLQYLVRGGRLSATAGAIGNALKIKPIIRITKDGKLEVKYKARGQKKAYKKMIGEIEGKIDLSEGNEIATMYTDDNIQLKELEVMMRKEYPELDFVEARVGAIIGAHVGPGAMGFAFVGKEKKTD